MQNGKEVRPLAKYTRDATVEERMIEAGIIQRGDIIRDPRLLKFLDGLQNIPLPEEYDFPFPRMPVIGGMDLLSLLQAYVDDDVFIHLTSATDDAIITAGVDIACLRANVLIQNETPLDPDALTSACRQQMERMKIIKALLERT